MRAVVDLFKAQFSDDDVMLEESAQIWRFDRGREFVFRIRRLVANELRVERIPMRHEQPLRYEWLKTHNILPEAMYAGGDCVARQVAVILGKSSKDIAETCKSPGTNSRTSRPLKASTLKWWG